MLPSSDGASNGHLRQVSSERRAGYGHRDRLRKPGRTFRAPRHRASGQDRAVAAAATPYDDAYFHSYSHLGVHEEMIKDHVRTDTYRTAIMQHQSSIQGKVVMDVGCGTGILSIFCALAGARKVYAVDASEIAIQANEVVKMNNLSEKIEVLHGRVEDIEIDEEIDVIISEWMGYMLLYESMLSSVITARDRWLKPGGLILPSHATLYMAPVTHSERYRESIDFWRNVYGIDMSAMLPLAKQCAFEEPSVEIISGENVLTWPFVAKHIDCYVVTIQELECVTARYRFSSMMRAPLHGFAFWFDVEFAGPTVLIDNHLQTSHGSDESPSDIYSTGSHQRKKRAKSVETLVLSTAPEDAPTHWQQTLLYLYEPVEVNQDQIIEGSVTLSQSKENPRFLNIHLEYASGGRSFVKESVMRCWSGSCQHNIANPNEHYLGMVKFSWNDNLLVLRQLSIAVFTVIERGFSEYRVEEEKKENDGELFYLRGNESMPYDASFALPFLRFSSSK